MDSFCNHNLKKLLKELWPAPLRPSRRGRLPPSTWAGDQPAPVAGTSTANGMDTRGHRPWAPASQRNRDEVAGEALSAHWGRRGWAGLPRKEGTAGKAQDGNVRALSESTVAAPKDMKTTGETSGTKETIREGEELAQKG